ncbi:MAG: HAMP domain-containing histidine kinase [Bacteroidetes bacterium]|nr:HAMP domain-containing histidine kinase [Bacteroidota bacterium]
MKKRNTVYLFYLIGLVIAGLIGIQLYWINNSIHAQKATLERSLKEDMEHVVKEVEEDAYCFTYYSKAFIKKGEGVYMVKQKCADGKFLGPDNGGYIDTLNLYNLFATRKDSVFINDRTVWFDNYAATVDVTMRFSFTGLNPDIRRNDTSSYQINNISSENFRQVLANKFKIDEAINLKLLNELVVGVLKKNKLDTVYSIGIQKGNNNGFEYLSTGADEKQLSSSDVKTKMLGDRFNTPYVLSLYVPDMFKSVIKSSMVMLVSSIVIVLILVVAFIYFIRTILNQERLSTMKNIFINNITHEFRTPITNINLAIENWKDNPAKGEVYMGIIEEENKHIERNVEQILELAVLESDASKKEFSKINVIQLVSDAVKVFDIQIQDAGGVITVNNKAVGSHLYGNELQLRNMLQNLIDNAIKYRSTNALIITISVYDTDSHFVLQVEDNGIGMNAETQKYIFNRFFRGNTGDRHDVKGFGLGMSYVKHIVDAHRGEINIKSKPGMGTRITIYLPKTFETK